MRKRVFWLIRSQVSIIVAVDAFDAGVVQYKFSPNIEPRLP
jgi:hypothetical protein